MKINLLLTTLAIPFLLSGCGSSNSGNDNNKVQNQVKKEIYKAKDKINDTGNDISVKNIDILKVDGREIKVSLPKGMNTRVLINSGNIMGETRNLVLSGNQYKYVKFGWVKDNGKVYNLAQGINPTKDMPVTGTATYDVAYMIKNQLDSKSSTLIADFGNKNLKGSLGEINIEAKINGNTFDGNKNGVQSSGQFFGPGAAELTGTFNKGDTVGSFGGQKQ